jgi:hypothetical protein
MTTAEHWRLWFISPNKEDSASLSLCYNAWCMQSLREVQSSAWWRRRKHPLFCAFSFVSSLLSRYRLHFLSFPVLLLILPRSRVRLQVENGQEALWEKKGQWWEDEGRGGSWGGAVRERTGRGWPSFSIPLPLVPHNRNNSIEICPRVQNLEPCHWLGNINFIIKIIFSMREIVAFQLFI